MIKYIIAAAGIILIAVSYFEVYKVKHITVAYKDQFGQMKGFRIDYAYRAKENWMDISEFEKYVAEKKNLLEVKIIKMQVKTQWKLRKAF
ncbi:MAG: hypothetical protein ACRC7I_07220 [Selenomonadaceae bacterium]